MLYPMKAPRLGDSNTIGSMSMRAAQPEKRTSLRQSLQRIHRVKEVDHPSIPEILYLLFRKWNWQSLKYWIPRVKTRRWSMDLKSLKRTIPAQTSCVCTGGRNIFTALALAATRPPIDWMFSICTQKISIALWRFTRALNSLIEMSIAADRIATTTKPIATSTVSDPNVTIPLFATAPWCNTTKSMRTRK